MINQMLCGERLLLANMGAIIQIFFHSLIIREGFQGCGKISQSLWVVRILILMAFCLELDFHLGMVGVFDFGGMNGSMA